MKNATDPISGLPRVFAGWFLISYLLVAIVQLFAINTIDLYSSGLTLQAIGRQGGHVVRKGDLIVVNSRQVGGPAATPILRGTDR